MVPIPAVRPRATTETIAAAVLGVVPAQAMPAWTTTMVVPTKAIPWLVPIFVVIPTTRVALQSMASATLGPVTSRPTATAALVVAATPSVIATRARQLGAVVVTAISAATPSETVPAVFLEAAQTARPAGKGAISAAARAARAVVAVLAIVPVIAGVTTPAIVTSSTVAAAALGTNVAGPAATTATFVIATLATVLIGRLGAMSATTLIATTAPVAAPAVILGAAQAAVAVRLTAVGTAVTVPTRMPVLVVVPRPIVAVPEAWHLTVHVGRQGRRAVPLKAVGAEAAMLLEAVARVTAGATLMQTRTGKLARPPDPTLAATVVAIPRTLLGVPTVVPIMEVVVPLPVEGVPTQLAPERLP